MQPMNKRKSRRPEPAPPGAALLTDPQAAAELGIGLTKLAELQRNDLDFPPAIWFGTRSKRHDRAALRAYVETKRRARCPRRNLDYK